MPEAVSKNASEGGGIKGVSNIEKTDILTV